MKQSTIFSILALAIGLLVSLQAPAALRAAELVERIVAVVNDDVITLSELNEAGRGFFRAVIEKTAGDKIEAALNQARHQVLTKLIDQRLLEQEAEKYGIEVSEEDIDRALNSIVMRNGMTREELLRGLKEMNTTEKEYREQIRQKILRTKLIGFEVKSKIVIPDERVEQYYNEYYSKRDAENAKGYHILQIGVRWGDKFRSKTKDEARRNAARLREMLLSGADFRDLARMYSDLPSAEDGGDIGVFAKEEMAPFMRDVVLALRPGQTSGVIETPTAFQILKLLSADGKRSVPPLDEVRDEIRQTLFAEEAEKNYDTWIAGLRARAYIKRNL